MSKAGPRTRVQTTRVQVRRTHLSGVPDFRGSSDHRRTGGGSRLGDEGTREDETGDHGTPTGGPHRGDTGIRTEERTHTERFYLAGRLSP